jgi:ferredoxin
LTAVTSPLVQLQRPTIATDQRHRASTRTVSLTIDEQRVSVSEGATILAACRELDIEIPTLCFLDTLHPVNACRICVVEVDGARVLVPSCSRAVEEGMVVHTQSPRVKHSRKLVLEMLASSVDLSTTPKVAEWIDQYEAKPERFGPPAPPAPPGTRDASVLVDTYINKSSESSYICDDAGQFHACF